MALDFRPDSASTDHRILSTCLGYFPYGSGYRSAYGAAASGYDTALTADCIGARAVKNDAGTTRAFFGSAAAIQEANGAGGWTDRSRGGGYTSGTNRWWFSQGITANQVIATNYADEMQSSTGAAFSNLSNAPKAKIVVTQSEALLAMYYNDGTTYANGIKISDRGAPTVWTATASNDATNINLVESPGEIVAGAAINDLVIAWKKRSMYVGRFVGGTEKWRFNLLSKSVGCSGIEAWVETPAGIIFFGESGSYIFDGSVPRPIDRGIKRTMRRFINAANSYGKNVAMTHDEANATVYMWMPEGEGVNGDITVAYNYVDDKWSFPYSEGFNDLNAGATYTAFQCNVRDYSLIDHKSLAGTEATNLVGNFIVTAQDKLVNMAEEDEGTLSGADTRMVTGQFGVGPTPDSQTTLERLTPIFEYSAAPTSGLTATFNSFAKASLNDTAEATKTATIDARGRFDGMIAGNHFSVQIDGTNKHYAIADLVPSLKSSGKR